MNENLRVVACNHVGSKIFRENALCFVVCPKDNDNVEVYGRSRSGRWVQKWCALGDLKNFREKTIPPEHPRYEWLHIYAYHAKWGLNDAVYLNGRSEKLRALGKRRQA